jgi:hypothetical protein
MSSLPTLELKSPNKIFMSYLGNLSNLYVILLRRLSRVLVTKTGFGLVIGFINNPQVVTTINSYTVTDLHNLKSLRSNLLSLSAIVFTYL